MQLGELVAKKIKMAWNTNKMGAVQLENAPALKSTVSMVTVLEQCSLYQKRYNLM